MQIFQSPSLLVSVRDRDSAFACAAGPISICSSTISAPSALMQRKGPPSPYNRSFLRRLCLP